MDDIEMAQRLTRVEDEVTHCGERLDKVEKDTSAIYDIASSVKVMASEMKGMSGRLDSMDEKIEAVTDGQKALSQKVEEVSLLPIRENSARWKKTVAYIGTALGGAVVAYLIGVLFPVLIK